LGHMDYFNGFFNILKVVVAWAVNWGTESFRQKDLYLCFEDER